MAEPSDVIVIGAGIAGLSCAHELAAAGLSVTQFEPSFPGGLVINVNELSGFAPAEGRSGMEYAGTLAVHNQKAGVRSVMDAVTAIQAEGPSFKVTTDSATHTARFVVLASGARLQKLNIPGEAEFAGLGVSECADCDAPLYAGAVTAIAGDGPWAVQDALLLARDSSAVHLICAASQPHAPEASLQALRSQPRIQVHTDSSVAEVLGNDQGVTGVRILKAGASSPDLPVSALFVMVGLEPNSEIAPPTIPRDEARALRTDAQGETSVPGLWAIGQVRAGFGGRLDDALDDARRAAHGIQLLAAS